MITFIDCNNLCYRAFYATGNMAYGGNPTGVVFGFLNQLFTIYKNYGPSIVPVFCWDSPKSLRRDVCPTYKRKEGEATPEQIEGRLEAYRQFDEVRTKVLPALGFGNLIFREEGFEADDLIAFGCANLKVDKFKMIVSSDEDLFQCLRNYVKIFNPGSNQQFTDIDFNTSFNITPDLWPHVKAIAGCSSDNVIGVQGVGEKTAIKYLTGELSFSNKKYNVIKQFVKSKEYETNFQLVKLPYIGSKFTMEVKMPELKKEAFIDVFDRYGLESFFKRMSTISNNLWLN